MPPKHYYYALFECKFLSPASECIFRTDVYIFIECSYIDYGYNGGCIYWYSACVVKYVSISAPITGLRVRDAMFAYATRVYIYLYAVESAHALIQRKFELD